jgi:hypothetical protein
MGFFGIVGLVERLSMPWVYGRSGVVRLLSQRPAPEILPKAAK